MICVSSRGGDYSAAPLTAFDFVETYLRTIFGFVGITDITFFNVQPMDIWVDARRAAQRQAIAEVRSFVADAGWGGSESNHASRDGGITTAPREVATALAGG
ncbi:MAG: NAD(P)H-dependent oxidoreductase [Chloroflexota bacterium]